LALLAAKRIWSPLEKLISVSNSQIAVAIIRPMKPPLGPKKLKPMMKPNSNKTTAISAIRTIEFLLFARINSHIISLAYRKRKKWIPASAGMTLHYTLFIA